MNLFGWEWLMCFRPGEEPETETTCIWCRRRIGGKGRKP